MESFAVIRERFFSDVKIHVIAVKGTRHTFHDVKNSRRTFHNVKNARHTFRTYHEIHVIRITKFHLTMEYDLRWIFNHVFLLGLACHIEPQYKHQPWK